MVDGCGFVGRIADTGELESIGEELCRRVVAQAPLTMAAAKEMMRRIGVADVADCDNLIRQVYGSEDFSEGVAAFLAKRVPRWRGL